MGKNSKIVVIILFLITLGLGAAALYVGSTLDNQAVNPEESSANDPCEGIHCGRGDEECSGGYCVPKDRPADCTGNCDEYRKAKEEAEKGCQCNPPQSNVAGRWCGNDCKWHDEIDPVTQKERERQDYTCGKDGAPACDGFKQVGTPENCQCTSGVSTCVGDKRFECRNDCAGWKGITNSWCEGNKACTCSGCNDCGDNAICSGSSCTSLTPQGAASCTANKIRSASEVCGSFGSPGLGEGVNPDPNCNSNGGVYCNRGTTAYCCYGDATATSCDGACYSGSNAGLVGPFTVHKYSCAGDSNGCSGGCSHYVGSYVTNSLPTSAPGCSQIDVVGGAGFCNDSCGSGGDGDGDRVPRCGDGICDTGEKCDVNARCDTGAGVFTPSECRTNCTYCGDGVLDSGEACDDGNSVDTDTCSNSCQVQVNPCGNGKCDPSEGCDVIQCSGTGLFTAGECRTNCTYCGDGVVQPTLGEACDDGNTVDNDTCSNACMGITTTCGNTRCDTGEACDTSVQCFGGGLFTPGECRVDCTYCGDGILQGNYGETCDDGNTNDNDSCNNQCTFIQRFYCGDGIMQPGEECEPSIPNSCGLGATCSPMTCICEPVGPGMCGSTCTGEFECPNDNTCYNGRCRLAICVPGYTYYPPTSSPYSSPMSGPTYPTNNYPQLSQGQICTQDGCNIIECGQPCGLGGVCPQNQACSTQGICVLRYCVENECENPCLLPENALFGKEIDMYITGIILVLVGILAYRFDLTQKGFFWSLNGIRNLGGQNILAMFTERDKKDIQKKSRNKFEDKFEKGKKKK